MDRIDSYISSTRDTYSSYLKSNHTGEPNCYNRYDDTFIKAKSIPARKRRWVIKGLIPCGEITAIVGNPEVGKTTLQATLASLGSNGSQRLRLEDGETIDVNCSGKVLWIAMEDCIESTIKPRAIAVGADMENLLIFQLGDLREYSCSPAEQRSRKYIDLIDKYDNVGLVLFDHIDLICSGYPETRSGRRQALLDMTNLARRKGFGVVANAHFGKSATRTTNPLDRIERGSIIGQTVRKVLYVEEIFTDLKDPESREFHLFDSKANISGKRTGLHYSIEGVEVPSEDGPIETSRIRFHRFIEHETVQELVSHSRKMPKPKASQVEKAKAFILDFLAKGPRWVKDFMEAAGDAGFSRSTIDRARAELGIVTWKPQGNGAHSGFLCCLPEQEGLEPEPDDEQDQLNHVPQVPHENSTE